MQFVPDKTYVETTLEDGLTALLDGKADRLYSDGLESNEYICLIPGRGFCYEDDCIIGCTLRSTINTMHVLGWCFSHKFFIEKSEE